MPTPLPPARHQWTARIALALLLLTGLTACAADPNGSPLPVPGATIAADPVAAAMTPIPLGLVVTVVMPLAETGADAAGREAAVAALEAYATQHRATLSTITGDAESSPDALLQQAVANRSDVVVTFGSDLLPALDRASSANLDQPFLIVGGQLPEPTENVTAVIWPGADARETTVIGANGELASGAVLGGRVPEAITIGMASIMSERSGSVLSLPTD